MTVCLTGDVHHMSLETRDQEYMNRTEVEAAIEYAEIAAQFDVPVTLFVTGKAAVEEPNRVEQLAAMDNVEVGGHNYWAFDTPVHTVWRALGKLTDGRIGSWNGPRRFQRYEIGRTLNALTERGATVTAWRDHAYRHDHHTAALLAAAGITHFSDAVGPDQQLRHEDGVTVVPVNTPPDHEHIFHAFRTPEFVADHDFSGPFGTDSYQIGQWLTWLSEHIDHQLHAEEPATVLAHPACMDLADNLTAFEQFCADASHRYDFERISDIKSVPGGSE